MNIKKCILFDLDGTVTDPGLGITNSVAYALDKFNIQVGDRAALYKFIGPPLQNSFKEFYHFSEEESLSAVSYYREYYREKGIYENRVYDGIEQLLSTLKRENKTVILATSKPEEFAKQILQYFNLTKYFDVIAGATMDSRRVEKADVIRYALGNIHEDLSRIVMVGDRKHDILGAKENHLDSIGVLYGYGDMEELREAGAGYIVEKPLDMLNHLG